ncbi:MAG: aminotransferase class V-fold PLP-dependent enzyme [Vicingaceae bacterium]
MINFTTGPVNIEKQVAVALSERPIPHRSEDFKRLYIDFSLFICKQFKVKRLAILQGSGSLANEAMIWQIKSRGGKGLILANGEFGHRLIRHSENAKLDFCSYSIPWGEEFDLLEIEQKIKMDPIDWVLFAHCETSTGVLNPLKQIARISETFEVDTYVDCMSSVGVNQLDLSNITMASCSSSKGLGSIPGIGMVLSNVNFIKAEHVPLYYDLSKYNKGRFPYSLSSNLINALHISAERVLNKEVWEQKNEQAKLIYNGLKATGVLPFAKADSKVFTIVQEQKKAMKLGQALLNSKIEVSYLSEYLLNRNWIQLTLFGKHTDAEINSAVQGLRNYLIE